MFYCNGKIIVHHLNQHELLTQAMEDLAHWMGVEKDMFFDVDDLELMEDEEKGFPYYQIPEGISAVDVYNALNNHNHTVKLCAINQSIWEKPDEVVRQYKYEFTPDEISQIGKEISKEFLEKLEVEAEKSAVMKGFKKRIDDLEDEMAKLSDKHQKGWEYRDARCYMELDFEAGKRHYRDKETGDLVDTEEMKQSDYQLQIIHSGAPHGTENDADSGPDDNLVMMEASAAADSKKPDVESDTSE